MVITAVQCQSGYPPQAIVYIINQMDIGLIIITIIIVYI